MHAAEVTAQQWFDHPGRHGVHHSQGRPQDYVEARALILQLTESRPLEPAVFARGIDSYSSLRWVFGTFEELAAQCTQAIRITGPSLIEFGALARAILEMEGRISSEARVWEEFRIRMKDAGDSLPNPANYNVLSLVRKAVRFVELLEDEEHYRDPDVIDQYRVEVLLQSPEWGDWRK